MKRITTALFLALFFFSTCVHASDSLKVKKVRFFIEPKVVTDLHIPANKTTILNGYDDDGGCIPSHGGYYSLKTNTQNKAVFSVGLSLGMSVKLSKHLFYEVSLSYYQNNQSSKIAQTQTYLSGTPETNINTTNTRGTYNYMGIGNGISYKCNKFSFTHTVLLYQFINYTQSTLYVEQNNYGYSTQSYLSSGNVITDGFDIKLFSEHKVGYSFLNNRIVPFIGVNINWSSSFNTLYGKTQFKPVWLPFASVKINF